MYYNIIKSECLAHVVWHYQHCILFNEVSAYAVWGGVAAALQTVIKTSQMVYIYEGDGIWAVYNILTLSVLICFVSMIQRM